MNNFFLKDKLQEFIVKNWQDYFDTREIINQISFLANKEKEKFVKVKNLPYKEYYTVSRFEMQEKGFILWIEFSKILSKTSVARGSCEYLITNTGCYLQEIEAELSDNL
jgi:hypothetical protein